jgi:hypothetical protein
MARRGLIGDVNPDVLRGSGPMCVRARLRCRRRCGAVGAR